MLVPQAAPSRPSQPPLPYPTSYSQRQQVYDTMTDSASPSDQQAFTVRHDEVVAEKDYREQSTTFPEPLWIQVDKIENELTREASVCVPVQ